jgi:beta-glucosidase
MPISWPRHVGQQPTFYNQIDAQHGYRYADLTQEPHFVFGEGLSYSSVAYDELGLELNLLRPEDTVRASVRVTNTGSRTVVETVQAYVRDVNTSATWADREFKAFAQVSLAPGESERVGIEIPVSACTIVTADGRRVVEPGAFELLVGPSSRLDDLLVAPFEVKV